MKMNSNFKNTSIGKIPVDWEDMKLEGIISKFIVPMRDKPKKFVGNIPWCRIEDIEGKYLSDTKSEQYVDETTVKDMNLKIHPAGTVICSCSARLGVCAITTTDLITNQTFIGLVPSKKVDKEFLYYMMSFSAERLQKLSSGTTIAYLSRQEFEKFRIPFPPIGEQQKIASILSTWDKAIELKERLIEQKKEQKKGLMQKLLTGEVRLPEFEGEWIEYQVDEICTLTRGRVISKKEMAENIGIYPVYSSQTSNEGKIGSIDTYDFDGEYVTWTTDGANAGTVFYRNGKFNCTNVCGVLKLKREDIDARYLAYVLASNTGRYVVRHGNPKLMNNIMEIIPVKIFNNFEFQKYICDFFDIVDKEINLIEKETNELKQQKKGLMQLLLTGKVRVKV